MAERETEFKYLLSEAEQSAIIERVESVKASRFINRYFDVGGGDGRDDWVLRLRLKEDKSILTLKIGREIGPGLFDSQEYSAAVESHSPEAWEDTEPLRVLRQEISRKPLRLKGEVRNTRVVVSAPVDVGREWELDRVEFPNNAVLFELEIEVAYESEEQLRLLRHKTESWLAKLGITAKPSLKTKYARFLELIPKELK